MIYFTSDLHLGHDREFLYGPRGFKNVADMNAAIVHNWNTVVDDDDDVFVLGDLMLNDNDAGMALLRKLKGHIYIILGNHDTDARVDLYETLPNVEAISYADRIKCKGYTFYLSHYPTITTNGNEMRPLNKAVINLFGHTHQKEKFYDNNPLMYHVGLDSHNNTPVSLDQIIADCEAQKAKISK